ncbi:saccharopine dehydrogenase NADP-binding domain-containing protein [Bradyrhizobium commune]|uniref:Saccharopine dehydrogenase NADP-binding domain-containing protein n=1 Tax=Bradyrhizobium commune TaxID=83627 RepID=A0A7S9D3T8_9BRAD|nr:saccharopine dehydrogenase NADP-binding domain-containing protein [Bradyrhizobium commune]QPF90677.1 saccharopine dehydrogenase NADP-binding domain-containing protein [Bradyrhizobium commune]
MVSSPIALYGATGVTGQLILSRLASLGLKPRLVGRDPKRLSDLADQYALSLYEAKIDDHKALAGCLPRGGLLVNAAGPFVSTAMPLIDAAMSLGCDYFDVSGELDSLRALLALDVAAKKARRVVIGGGGFGIAATDILVSKLEAAFGPLESVRVSVAADSAFSTTGVAESTLAVLAGGGAEIVSGEITRVRLARKRWRERTTTGASISFASAPLADLIAASRLTHAPDIVAGVPMLPMQAQATSLFAPLLPLLLKVPQVRRALVKKSGHAGVAGHEHVSRAWVRGTQGRRSQTLMIEGGEGFALAADIAAHAIARYLQSPPLPGAYTPACALGPEWLDGLAGIRFYSQESEGMHA